MEDPIQSPPRTEEALQRYRQEGYLLLPGLVTGEYTRTLHREVMEIMDIIGLGQTKLRQTTEYLKGSALDRLVNSPTLLQIAGWLMEGPSTLYMPFTAVKSGALPGAEVGGGEFHFHQDNQYTRFDGPGINLWFALTPMREANGCLRVVPGSHQNGTLPWLKSPDRDAHRTVAFTVTDSVPLIMEPGDCVAFSRLTVHGSGPNQTPDHRAAYAVQFHRDDVQYSTDGGETWANLQENPRYRTAPVDTITPPKTEIRD